MYHFLTHTCTHTFVDTCIRGPCVHSQTCTLTVMHAHSDTGTCVSTHVHGPSLPPYTYIHLIAWKEAKELCGLTCQLPVVPAPHIDPAVVAAQPMMRPPSVNSQPPQTSLLPAGFPAPPMVDQSCDSESQDPLSLSQQSLTQSNLDFSGASQSFAQAGLSHSQNLSGGVVADALFQASVEDSAAAPSQQHSSHGMMGQGRGTGEPAAQFDLPPSIPMPPSQSQQVSWLDGHLCRHTGACCYFWTAW